MSPEPKNTRGRRRLPEAQHTPAGPGAAGPELRRCGADAWQSGAWQRRDPRQHGRVFSRVCLCLLVPLGAPRLCAADEVPQSWNPLAILAEKRRLGAEIEAGERRLAAMPEARVVAQAHGRVGFHGRAAEPAWITLDLGRVMTPDEWCCCRRV